MIEHGLEPVLCATTKTSRDKVLIWRLDDATKRSLSPMQLITPNYAKRFAVPQTRIDVQPWEPSGQETDDSSLNIRELGYYSAATLLDRHAITQTPRPSGRRRHRFYKRISPSSAIDKSPPRKCSRCGGMNIDLGLRSYQRATRRASADRSLSLLTASRTTELIDGTTHLIMGSAPLEGQNRSPYAGDASGRAVVTSGSALSSKTSFTRSGAEHMIPAVDVTKRSAGSLAARNASARHSNERGWEA